MKRIRPVTVLLTILLSFALLLSLCACGQTEEAPAESPAAETDAADESEEGERADESEDEEEDADDGEDHEGDYNEEEPGWHAYYDEASMTAAGWSTAERGENEILRLENGDASLWVTVRWIGSITSAEYFEAQRAEFLTSYPDGQTGESWETPWGYDGEVYRAGGVVERCSYLEGYGIEIRIDAGTDETLAAETEQSFFNAAFDIYAAG